MKISARIRLLSCGLVLVTAVLIGWIVYRGYLAFIESQGLSSLTHLAQSDASRLKMALAAPANDARLLASLPTVKHIADGEASEGVKRDLADVFRELMASKPFYDQVRLIGAADGGREIVRVDNRNGKIAIVPDVRLQQKGHRDYFRPALERPAGQLYISAINLNREKGEIEVPHRPMLRVATPVYRGGPAPFGFIIINVDFHRFIEDLFHLTTERHGYFLANQDGDFLLHPDSAKAYGFDLGTRVLAQEEFPFVKPLFQASSSNRGLSAVTQRAGDRLYYFEKLHPFADDPDRYVVLGISADNHDLTASTESIARWAAAATLVLIGIAVVAGYALSAVMTRPLGKITTAAQQITRGGMDAELPSERNDEIGVLARAFKHMVDALKENESKLLAVNSELAIANADLEHFTHIAAHDLREPLRKQRNLADLLRDEIPDDPTSDARALLSHVVTCSDQMSRMIQDFRVLTKLDVHDVTREPVNLRALIEKCLDNFRPQLEERNVEIRFDEFPEKYPLYASLLELLYHNLIANVLTHAKSGGIVLHFTAVQRETGGLSA